MEQDGYVEEQETSENILGIFQEKAGRELIQTDAGLIEQGDAKLYVATTGNIEEQDLVERAGKRYRVIGVQETKAYKLAILRRL